MAIKYDTVTGASDTNRKAQDQRKTVYEPKLKGMRCAKCNQDTVIRFVHTGSGYVNGEIEACCEEFEKKINDKIWPNKY